jgi:hypothetical protein
VVEGPLAGTTLAAVALCRVIEHVSHSLVITFSLIRINIIKNISYFDSSNHLFFSSTQENNGLKRRNCIVLLPALVQKCIYYGVRDTLRFVTPPNVAGDSQTPPSLPSVVQAGVDYVPSFTLSLVDITRNVSVVSLDAVRREIREGLTFWFVCTVCPQHDPSWPQASSHIAKFCAHFTCSSLPPARKMFHIYVRFLSWRDNLQSVSQSSNR